MAAKAATHPLLRLDARNFLARVTDTAARGQHTHQSRQESGLARAVGPNDCDYPPFFHAQTGLMHGFDLAVGHAQTAHFQQRAHLTPPR